MAESPGRVEADPGGKATRIFWSASQTTPQRPDAASSVASVVVTTEAPVRREAPSAIASERASHPGNEQCPPKPS
jgi:hypothetical protein